MLKKVFLVVSLILVIGFTGCAEKHDSADDFRISLVNGETAVKIIGYAGTKQTINIPPIIQGKPVVEIGDDAFAKKEIINVTIPNSITSIGVGAFRENLLTSVTIPDKVTHIGIDAFAFNELTSVNIPNSVIYLSGFAGNQLTNIIIPESVTTIGEWAFYSNKLSSIIIPNNVTTIPFNLDLNNITIGANVNLRNRIGSVFGDNFDEFYRNQGRRAGKYILSGKVYTMENPSSVRIERSGTWSVQ